jgi:hypothetical protein
VAGGRVRRRDDVPSSGECEDHPGGKQECRSHECRDRAETPRSAVLRHPESVAEAGAERRAPGPVIPPAGVIATSGDDGFR